MRGNPGTDLPGTGSDSVRRGQARPRSKGWTRVGSGPLDLGRRSERVGVPGEHEQQIRQPVHIGKELRVDSPQCDDPTLSPAAHGAREMQRGTSWGAPGKNETTEWGEAVFE